MPLYTSFITMYITLSSFYTCPFCFLPVLGIFVIYGKFNYRCVTILYWLTPPRHLCTYTSVAYRV